LRVFHCIDENQTLGLAGENAIEAINDITPDREYIILHVKDMTNLNKKISKLVYTEYNDYLCRLNSTYKYNFYSRKTIKHI